MQSKKHCLYINHQHNQNINPRDKLELNTEKEGFMAYTDPEDAQRPRAVYGINPDFRSI